MLAVFDSQPCSNNAVARVQELVIPICLYPDHGCFHRVIDYNIVLLLQLFLVPIFSWGISLFFVA